MFLDSKAIFLLETDGKMVVTSCIKPRLPRQITIDSHVLHNRQIYISVVCKNQIAMFSPLPCYCHVEMYLC